MMRRVGQMPEKQAREQQDLLLRARAREQLELLLRAAAESGAMKRETPVAAREVRPAAGRLGEALASWRLETPTSLIGATMRDGRMSIAWIPITGVLTHTHPRGGSTSVQRKIAFAKPVGEALDPGPLMVHLGLREAENHISPQPPEERLSKPTQGWLKRMISRGQTSPGSAPATSPSEGRRAGVEGTPPWPLKKTVGGMEIGMIEKYRERIEHLQSHPDAQTGTRLSYELQRAPELLEETIRLYLDLPARKRNPHELRAALEALIPQARELDPSSDWEAHKRFLLSRR